MSGAALGTQQLPGAGGTGTSPCPLPHLFGPSAGEGMGQSSSEGPATCPHGVTGPGGRGCPPTQPPFPLRSTHALQPHTEHLLARQGGSGGAQPAHTARVPRGCAPRVESHHAHPKPHMHAHSRACSRCHAHAAWHACGRTAPRTQAVCVHTLACRLPHVSGVTRAVRNVSHALAAICACACVITHACTHPHLTRVCTQTAPRAPGVAHTRAHAPFLPVHVPRPSGTPQDPAPGQDEPRGLAGGTQKGAPQLCHEAEARANSSHAGTARCSAARREGTWGRLGRGHRRGPGLFVSPPRWSSMMWRASEAGAAKWRPGRRGSGGGGGGGGGRRWGRPGAMRPPRAPPRRHAHKRLQGKHGGQWDAARSGLPGMGTRTGTAMATSGCFGVAGTGHKRGHTTARGSSQSGRGCWGWGQPSPLTHLRGGTHAAVG